MNKKNDSIIRYCKPSQIQDGKVLVGAFHLRKKDPVYNRPEDEKELSVHQFEFFYDNNYQNLKKYLTTIKFSIKPEGCFAKIKYSEVEEMIKNSFDIEIDINQDTDSPHCLISNLYTHDEEVAYSFVESINEVIKIKVIKIKEDSANNCFNLIILLARFVPFALLSQAQNAPIASRPELQVKQMIW
jgi:hypothetical protein